MSSLSFFLVLLVLHAAFWLPGKGNVCSVEPHNRGSTKLRTEGSGLNRFPALIAVLTSSSGMGLLALPGYPNWLLRGQNNNLRNMESLPLGKDRNSHVVLLDFGKAYNRVPQADPCPLANRNSRQLHPLHQNHTFPHLMLEAHAQAEDITAEYEQC